MPSFNKLGTAVPTAALSSFTVAQQLTIDATLFPYTAPGSADSRGSCPALNELANHGILPRDGKNIDMADGENSVQVVGHGDGPAGVVMFGVLKTSTTGNASTLNLGDFAQHTPRQVEYDGCISIQTGRTIWQAGSIQPGGLGPQPVFFDDAATDIAARTKYAQEYDPTYQKALGRVRAHLHYTNLFYIFGSPSNGNANRTMVKVLFEQERLPLELSWTPPKDISIIFGLATLTGEIDLAALEFGDH